MSNILKVLIFSRLCLLNITCFSQELPIKATRTISFTTDEGSFMNIDVSPDGKTLAFDLLGDIYIVPVTGGKATQLTRGLAFHLRPVWSPNSKMIAYLSDISGGFHLNVMNLTGTFHQILGKYDKELDYMSDAVWTSDGLYIAIAGTVYGLAGGQIATGITFKNPIRFYSDGKLIYCVDSGWLSVYNREIKSKTKLPAIVQGAKEESLSPDGRWWAYIKDSGGNRSLLVQDLTSNTSRILVPSLIAIDPRYKPWKFLRHFSFSPDSKSIYIGYAGKIHRIDVQTGSDNIVPFTANVKADLGPFNYHTFPATHDSVKVHYIRSIHVSPDNKHIVFSALSTLYILDLPNGKPHILAPQQLTQFQPVYSPDGRWIAYVTWSDTVGGALWRISAAGGQPQQLTQIPGQYQCPAWSPDGSLIAVIKGVNKLDQRDDLSYGRLTLVPVNGGPVHVINDSIPMLWSHLAFSSNGFRVIYTPKDRRTRTSLSPQLVSQNLDGTDLQTIAIGSRFTHYLDKSLSPDGRYIVYSADEDLYLIPTCKLTSPLIISDESKQGTAIRFAEGIDPYWEQGGKMLAWSYANKFYRINPDKVIAAAEKAAEQNKTTTTMENEFLTVAVHPDQTIPLNLTVPYSHPNGVLALRNTRIITMRQRKVIEHGTILMNNGRITAVGSDATISIPHGAKIVDLPGTTVMPGFVDLHLHMRVPTSVFPHQSWMFLVNLAYGVTTARDPSANYDNFGYAELLASGQMIGPRLFTVGRAVRRPEGVIRIDNPEDASAVARKRVELGAIVVKDYLPSHPRLPRQWLLQACNKNGINITNEGWFDPIMQLGMFKDGCTGVEHNAWWGDIYKDVITFIAASGTYYTPTLQVSSGDEIGEGKEYFKYKYWHGPNKKLEHFTLSDSSIHSSIDRMESYEAIIRTICKDSTNPQFLTPARIDARIRNAGGRVTMGSHGECEGIGAHNELWALQMGGLTNMQALQAATIMGAEALGIQKDVGSIEPGKIADLIILNKNPLDDIHNSREIRYVMKDGILYDGDTLDEIWPIPKKCPEWRLKIPLSQESQDAR